MERGGRIEMKRESVKDLITYPKAYNLAFAIYRMAKDFLSHDLPAMALPMPRAAVIIRCNITGGCHRRFKGNAHNF